MLSRILGTGAAAEADVNLILQIAMGVALLAGAVLARMKRFTAHAICQAAVLLINTVAIASVMWPSFQHTVLPHIHKHCCLAYYLWPIAHGALGAFAELFGVYIALVAGTNLLPAKLKFHRWKFWMRFELALWWLVLLTGIGTYLYWYTAIPLP
jgi:uncharacterized membrane protein YozB (DUF420 family)